MKLEIKSKARAAASKARTTVKARLSKERTFSTFNPATGEELARYPNSSPLEVAHALDRVRSSQAAWSALGYKGRKKILLQWAKYLSENIEEGAEKISEESGKPLSDARLEFTLAIGHLSWAARNAGYVLADQRRRPGLLMANMNAKVERIPYGVIGVIGPWNYPAFTPMGSIAYALAAGNGVLFKPSEFAPGVGLYLAQTFHKISPIRDIFLTITGLGSTGESLALSGVDKVSFTGSTRTAKKVAATLAEQLIPAVFECGGKDPVIVDSDADIDRAVETALWSGLSNAGQTCIGAERIYAHEKIADTFIEKLVERAREIQPGIHYGPATMPSQLKVISAHINDAKKRGGKFHLGSVESIGERYVWPIIISDLPEDALALREETFGPTLVINRVKDMDEAIALANNSTYGLGAAVWSKKNGEKIASSLKSGMVSINSVISFAAVASVPFGGVKESGYGRIHGAEGLLEFTYPKSTVRARFQLPILFTAFTRSERADKLIIKIVKLLNGKSLG